MNICAVATAQGGAIGVIRVSGPNSINIADRLFRGRRSLCSAQGYTLHYGKIVDASADSVQCETEVDDVIVSVFRKPDSYTGEDSVEISCHGSSFILSRVINLLIQNGCRLANPGEYTQRAFLNGKMDLSQAEAVADLIASKNASQHRVAMLQMRGGISKRLTELRGRLLEMTALLELELDFSEEDVEFADRKQLLMLAREIQTEIHRLSKSFTLGNAIKNGIPVAIIGAPNVGKSTLLNRLLHEDKAIVSDIQGTTRDLIEDTTYISSTLDGVRKEAEFRFIDTAGIRHTEDTIEQMGIERSLGAAERAHIIILMRDQDNDYPDLTIRPDQTVIKVNNKSQDFQAINGIGITWLETELLKAVPHEEQSDVLITNLRHKQALDLAYEDINRAISSILSAISGDLISEDLRLCITHISDISGTPITPTDTLRHIFSHFCIGK